jgi:hypothetical protein
MYNRLLSISVFDYRVSLEKCVHVIGSVVYDCHVSVAHIIQPRMTAAASTKSLNNLQQSIAVIAPVKS